GGIGVAHGASRKSRRSLLAVRSIRPDAPGVLVVGAHDLGTSLTLRERPDGAMGRVSRVPAVRRGPSVLAVPVVERLEAPDHAEAAGVKLLRAGGPAHRVGGAPARSPAHQALRAGPEGVR